MSDTSAPGVEHSAPSPLDASTDGFATLQLAPQLLRGLGELGYEEPTDVQREAIPPLLSGRDLLAEAPTGTGKTAAFALPLLQRLEHATGATGAPVALVLVPTRELAMQVAQAVHRYGREVGARVVPIYGGQSIQHQLHALRRGVDVVVATPGRALDHLKRGSLNLAGLRMVVLDEADEMLDMGFAEDLEEILAATPAERQTALFSATISQPIARIAARHLRDPVRVTIARPRTPDDGMAAVRQVAYVVARPHKLAALSRLLDVEAAPTALIFARTRTEVDELTEALSGRGYDVGALHGGLSQEQRDRILGRFRQGALQLLVATDVAARGLDIPHVSHVVNYDVPSAPEAYVHRIGRTGRAGRTGVAVTLVEPREQRLLRRIEGYTGMRLELARLPTVADLRERRLEVMRATLREALLGDGFDRYRAVVEPLAEEFDLIDIAMAATSLADPAERRPDESDVPLATLPTDKFRPRQAPDAAAGRGKPRRRPPEAPAPGRRAPRGDRDGADMTRLHVNGGRRAGIRPGDLVGAITNEAGVTSEAIGAIQISDNFALVDVRSEEAQRIVNALRQTRIRGKRVIVRPDRGATG